MSDLNPLVVLGMDIGWVVWVDVLRRVLDQPMRADKIASAAGLVLILVAVLR